MLLLSGLTYVFERRWLDHLNLCVIGVGILLLQLEAPQNASPLGLFLFAGSAFLIDAKMASLKKKHLPRPQTHPTGRPVSSWKLSWLAPHSHFGASSAFACGFYAAALYALFSDAGFPVWGIAAAVPEYVLAVGFWKHCPWVGKLGMGLCLLWSALLFLDIFYTGLPLGIWHCTAILLLFAAERFSKFRWQKASG
jgi:hypothetical protein